MVVEIIDASGNDHVIHANEPSAKKTVRATSGHDQFQVRHNESLRSELKSSPI
jgi:hypothetical protein